MLIIKKVNLSKVIKQAGAVWRCRYDRWAGLLRDWSTHL